MVPVAVDEELHRAGVHVADGLGNLHGVGAQLFAHVLGHAPGRAELHDLLIAALQRAVALAQVAHVAVLVGEYLHLDVLGLHEVLLHEDAVVAEGLAGLAAHELEGGGHVLQPPAQAHTAPAAAGRRLQYDGEAELNCLRLGLGRVLQGLRRAGYDGHAAADGYLLRLELVAHLGEDSAGRADELYARVLAGLREGGVLAQEAVARVYGVHAALFGEGDNLVYREIGPQRAQVLAYEIGLVRLRAEEVHRVLLRVYGDRAQVEVVARAEYAYGYLAAVRRHDLPEGVQLLQLNHLPFIKCVPISPRSARGCGACSRYSTPSPLRGSRAHPGPGWRPRSCPSSRLSAGAAPRGAPPRARAGAPRL